MFDYNSMFFIRHRKNIEKALKIDVEILTSIQRRHSHERAIRVCPVVKSPLFRLSGRSSDTQLQFAPIQKTQVF